MPPVAHRHAPPHQVEALICFVLLLALAVHWLRNHPTQPSVPPNAHARWQALASRQVCKPSSLPTQTDPPHLLAPVMPSWAMISASTATLAPRFSSRLAVAREHYQAPAWVVLQHVEASLVRLAVLPQVHPLQLLQQQVWVPDAIDPASNSATWVLDREIEWRLPPTRKEEVWVPELAVEHHRRGVFQTALVRASPAR